MALIEANINSGGNAIITLLKNRAPQTLEMLAALDGNEVSVFNSIDDRIKAAIAFFSEEKNDTAPTKTAYHLFLAPRLNDVESKLNENYQSNLTKTLERRFQRAWQNTYDLIMHSTINGDNLGKILSDENIAEIFKSILVRDDYTNEDFLTLYLSDKTIEHLLFMSVEFPETSELMKRRHWLVKKFNGDHRPSLFDSTAKDFFDTLIERRDVSFFEAVIENVVFGKKLSEEGLGLLDTSISLLKQKMDDDGRLHANRLPSGDCVYFSEQDNLSFRWAIFRKDAKTIKFYNDHQSLRISQGVLNELLYTHVDFLVLEEDDDINNTRYFECDPDASIVKQLIDMGAQIDGKDTHVLTNFKYDNNFSSQFKKDLFTYLVSVYRQQKPNDAEAMLEKIINNPLSAIALEAFQSQGIHVDIGALAINSQIDGVKKYCLSQLKISNDPDKLMDYFSAIVLSKDVNAAETFIVHNPKLVRAFFPWFIECSHPSAQAATNAVWRIVEPYISRSQAENASDVTMMAVEQKPIEDFDVLQSDLMEAFAKRDVLKVKSLLTDHSDALREINFTLLKKTGVQTPLYSVIVRAAKRDCSARAHEALLDALEVHCYQNQLYPGADHDRPAYTIIQETDLASQHPRNVFEILSSTKQSTLMSFFWNNLMHHVVRGRKLLQADLA